MKKTVFLFALISLLIPACSSGVASSTLTRSTVPQVLVATASAILPTAIATATVSMT